MDYDGGIEAPILQVYHKLPYFLPFLGVYRFYLLFQIILTILMLEEIFEVPKEQ